MSFNKFKNIIFYPNLAILLSCLLLFSCAEEKTKIPDGILSIEKMRIILADLHFLEISVEDSYKNKKDQKLAYFNHYELELMKKHNITKSEFDSSYVYYARNIELMDEIYSQIVDSLGSDESKLKIRLNKK